MTDVRTLLVEDNPGDARLLRAMLPKRFVLTHVERLDAAIRALAEPVDVVLLDLSLPDSHGLDTFRRLHAAAPDVPVLVLTGDVDDAGAVLAVREGAQDWLVKGHADGELLSRALRYAIERNRLAVRLRELDRTRSLFLSVVSHDLKSPLASVLAGVDMLLGGALGDLNPQQRRAVELTRTSALRQARLVNDLLDVAVIEAGAVLLHPVALQLCDLVDAAVAEIAPLAALRQVCVHRGGCALTHPETGHPDMRGDPDRMAQAVGNLLANAVKFARSQVEIRCVQTQTTVSISVEDDGPGVPEALVGSLFQRFVRAEGPESGSGLGLSIVRGVAEAHRGSVSVENRPEGGARFVMTLPRS